MEGGGGMELAWGVLGCDNVTDSGKILEFGVVFPGHCIVSVIATIDKSQ